eukprot:CAMPEP_0173091788 /NCGR_PEP_ID=MMETSP1102-20130122/28366_1 /TAXON_ID=49646 /ORGANISM="Geminigera sp., Strain Caron Lab Isolate" /LENGTH=42 /DNA_ID= /DNA_START= /DNA_END= /DNA_ORIENTATION=
MAEALHMQPSPTTWAMAYAHHAAAQQSRVAAAAPRACPLPWS